MAIENQVVNLISKLMKENVKVVTGIESSYQKLDNFFNDDFVKCLDLGFYNDNSSLIAEIRRELVLLRFWDSFPMLYGKQYVNVFSSLDDMRQYIEKIVKLEEWFFENEKIPVVFTYRDVEDFSISAFTYDDKIIDISKEEYVLINNGFDNYDIEPRKLIRFFVVGFNCWNKKNCLCVWQEQLFEEDDVIQCFQKTNYINVLYGRSILYINRRLLSIKQNELFVLSSDEVLTQVSELSLENRNDRVKGLLQEERFLEILRYEIVNDINKNTLNKIRSLLFEVETYYKFEIGKLQAIKKEMHEDLLHLSEGKIKESISEFLREQQEKERLYVEKLAEYQKISGELIELIRKYEVLRDKEYIGEKREYDYQYDTY